MEELALGEIGLNINYFYALTPRQFANTLTGYFRRQDRQQQDSWLQTREIIYMIYRMTETKGKKIEKEKLFPFPWEFKNKEVVVKPKTQEELRKEFYKNEK